MENEIDATDPLTEATILVRRHDPCGPRGCSVAGSMASNDCELNDIIGECSHYQNMRPLLVALEVARTALRWYGEGEYDSRSSSDVQLQSVADEALAKIGVREPGQ